MKNILFTSHTSIVSLKQAILATLEYFDILNFPLTLEEITEYLYGWSAPQEAIEEEIRRMPEVSHLHGYYFLRGRSELAELRKERKKIEAALWQKVDRWRFIFACCPFVRMVAIYNSLSYGNVKNTSDIDLFVITDNNRLATARFFMKFLTQIFGVRVHDDKIAGRFCLSFFVTEGSLNLQPFAFKFDPYFAYFIKTMRPVTGAKFYSDFLAANNGWTAPYFRRDLSGRNSFLRRHVFYRLLQRTAEAFFKIFGGKLEDWCSAYLSKRENTHHQKFAHSKGIVRNKNVFKFHEDDPREKIADQFRVRLNSSLTGVPKKP